jgi:Protein of unknown function (DUF5818)
MKIKTTSVALYVVLAALSASSGFAQSTTSTPKSKADIRTMTGCLAKGGGSTEFLLTANDGSTWEIQSSKEKLADHVGHQVTITGVVSHAKAHNLKEDAKSAAVDSGIKKNDSEHGHMKVTDLKMVSDSCK